MNAQLLDESWRIVLVVTPQNAHQLRRSLDDVLVRSFSTRISILAVDDPVVRGVLVGLELPVDYSLPMIEPGSYWVTVLSAQVIDTDRTIFLLSGTRVPEHWDARLVAAGQRSMDAVAIAPLCVRHPILSAFTNPDHQPGLTVEEVDQWLNDYAQGIEFIVPVMLESCLLLQGDYWRQATFQVCNDRELLDVLRLEAGFLLATDQVYIDDSQTMYSRDISFLPPAFLTAYTRRHTLTDVRHALTELSSRAEKPAELQHCLPVVVHVGHSWGGGLSRWIENYIEADVLHHHLVLRSIGDWTAFGQKIALYPGAEMRVPLRTWVLSEPILSTVTTHYEYRRLLQEIISDFNVESLLISSLIGHSMDLLRSPLAVTYVLHDFFPFCSALYATFGDPCHSCNADELSQCIRSNPLHSYFKAESEQHWLEIRSAFLALIMDRRINLVSPSQSVINRYVVLEESLRDRGVQVIEHGLSRDVIERLSQVRYASNPAVKGRLKIVILGRMTREKGGELLAEFIEDVAGFSDIWLLGAGENGQQFKGMSNVTVVDEYSQLDLDAHLISIAPDIGLLLSIVPETFSYTLSELWAAGIPVLATRLGAFGDRIIDRENGWLEPLNADHIRDRLLQINENRDELKLVREHLIQQPIRSAIEMVQQYRLIGSDKDNIPVRRYFLPRKTYQNPYRKQIHEVPNTVLYIDRQATYRGVLREFLQYSAEKVDQTPRISMGAKKILKRIIDIWIRALSPNKAKI